MSDKVVLKVDTVYTYVQGSRSVDEVIDNVLKVRPKGFFWTKAYKMGFWDGYKRFYDVLRRRFLTGFLRRVCTVLMDKGIEFEIIGAEKVFKGWEGDVKEIKLYGIDEERWEKTQLPVLAQMLEAKRGAVRMGTGAGKTEVVAGLLKALSDKRALVMVHRMELMYQTAERFKERLGEKVGLIGEGKVEGLDNRIVVGMVQTLWSRKPKLASWLKNEVDVLVVDETHRLPARTWANIAMVCGAEWRYGLSGTPLVYDDERDMLLIGVTGDIIEGVRVKDLVSLGYAIKPIVNVVVVPLKVVGSWYKVFEEVYGSNASMLEILKRIVEKEVSEGRKNIVVFVDRIRHGLRIYNELKEKMKGLQVVFACGDLASEERKSILEQMRRRKYDVVVATMIFDEGIDVAGIGGIVFWCSTKSVVRVLQRIGRGVRVEEGKSDVQVWDFLVDNRYLREHLRKRLKYYKEEQLEVHFYAWNGTQLVSVNSL